MKIIILGAGQVGGTLAENLAGENNDITIVDTDSERLRELQDKFDLRVVNGHGAHPRVLREAGVPVGVGAEVVLWGRGAEGAHLPVDEVAQFAGTIAYELLCAVAPRVPFAVDGA